MPDPETPGQKIQRQIAAIRSQGGTDDDVATFLSAHPDVTALDGGQQAAPTQQYVPRPLPEVQDEPSYAQQALGGVASLARNIPGAEALQAGARSLLRGQPYTEALSDIRGAEDTANPWVRRGNALVGGLLSAGAAPGSGVVAQGAGYGAASGLLNADPSSVADRLKSAGTQAAVDAVAGKVGGEMIPQSVRRMLAPALDKASLLRKDAISAFDKFAYGRAASEGVLAGEKAIPSIVTDTFNDPDVKPYVDAIRNSSVYQGASPSTIISEAYKLMSERQGKLGTMMANSADFKAGSSLEHAEITSAKQKLLDAADHIMPSFRSAVEGHAELAGQRDAFKAARDATKNIIEGTSGATKKLTTASPEAFMRSIGLMSPEEARAATQGLLGQMKETPTALSGNPLKLAGIPKAVARSGRLAPYLAALDARTGTQYPSLLRGAAIAGGGLLAR
jgi:hypothetical protein